MARHRILIAGAGIGGLTAGASLLQAGHDVTIFEQASELSEVGAGLQLSGNATHVLHYIGLGAARRVLRLKAVARATVAVGSIADNVG